MNHWGTFAAALLLVGTASGSSLFSRDFNPDLVERPIEEYREHYKRHLSERQNDECTADQISACDEDACPGWTLVNGDEEDRVCGLVDGHKTESAFYVPDKKQPCCKYHGCVVADCKQLTSEFRYDSTKKCTADNTPEGKEDQCKHRVEKKVCGCLVTECEEKGCSMPPKCEECHDFVPEFDQCGCVKKDSCVLKRPDPAQATCDSETTCNECFTCKKEKIFGQECAKKYPLLDKSYCERKRCPEQPQCGPCQTIPSANEDKCGCPQITCQDASGPANCKKPDANGKCENDCEQPVEKPLKEGGACNQTVTCCEEKKCAKKESVECDACHKKEVVTDECDCDEPVCKLDERLEMCKAKIEYSVLVKVRSAPTAAGLMVKITGACTPEQQHDPSAPLKECHIKIPAESFNQRTADVDQTCENIGLVKAVEVENNHATSVFVEDVVVEYEELDPKEGEKTKTVTVKVNKNVEPYEKVEVDTDEIIGLQCGKCHDLVMDEGVECSSLKEGKCLPKGCPEEPYCENECDLEIFYEGECGCSKRQCVKTIKREEECPPDYKSVLCPAAPCGEVEDLTYCCVPVDVCEAKPEPKCDDQCQKPVNVSVNENDSDGKPWPCPVGKCENRDEKECMTKEKAEEHLKCGKCFEAVETENKTSCGCREWVCAPKEHLQQDCSKCGPCQECQTVHDEECNAMIEKCMPKKCKEQPRCEVAKMFNGVPEVDQCDCPIYEEKICNNDHAETCQPGHAKIVKGKDGCGCDSRILVSCDAKPECNSTCKELVTKADGPCCNKYTCQRKTCPADEVKECKRCYHLVTEKDACGCPISRCERRECAAAYRCPNNTEPVHKMDSCGCPVTIHCKGCGPCGCESPWRTHCPKPLEICEEECEREDTTTTTTTTTTVEPINPNEEKAVYTDEEPDYNEDPNTEKPNYSGEEFNYYEEANY